MKYRVIVTYNHCSVERTYEIEAASAEEAELAYRNGNHRCVSEDVTDVDGSVDIDVEDMP